MSRLLARSTALRVSSRSVRSATSASSIASSANRLTAISIAGTRSRLGERLDQVGHRAGVAGPLDQLALAERGQDHDRRDPLAGDLLGRGDPVEDRHLDVEDDQVRPVLLGELDGGRPVAGLADDVVPLLGEHLDEVHADQDLVLGHHDGPGPGPPALGWLGHGPQANGPWRAALTGCSRVDAPAAAYAARNCSTSARSSRRREHSVAAVRAFATACSLLATAHRHMLLYRDHERNCSESIDFCQGGALIARSGSL